MATHVRKNDVVQVISGDHKGALGKVLHLDRDRQRVVIEGVNIGFRHVRPARRKPQGGRVQKEAPIRLSNVLRYGAAWGRGPGGDGWAQPMAGPEFEPIRQGG